MTSDIEVCLPTLRLCPRGCPGAEGCVFSLGSKETEAAGVLAEGGLHEEA